MHFAWQMKKRIKYTLQMVLQRKDLSHSRNQLCIHNSKSHNTVEYKIHTQIAKPQLKCFIYGDDHMVKDCPKPRKTRKETPQTSDQTSAVYNLIHQCPYPH